MTTATEVKDDSVLVGEFKGTKVRIKEFEGKKYVDVRKYSGDVPTKKGIMINVDNLSECISMLEKAEHLIKVK